MINSLPWYRWPIEIDGLPNLKMVMVSMAMLNNQMVMRLKQCHFYPPITVKWFIAPMKNDESGDGLLWF